MRRVKEIYAFGATAIYIKCQEPLTESLKLNVN